jgi:hypothetical protein
VKEVCFREKMNTLPSPKKFNAVPMWVIKANKTGIK